MKFNLPHPRSKKCLKKNMPKWKVVLWLKYHMCIEHQDLRAHIRIQGSMYGEHRPKASGEKEVIRAAVPQETKTWAPCPLLPWSTITHLSCVCVHIQSCPTLCNPTDCSPPGSSVHGIFQASIMRQVAITSSMGSSWPRDWTCFSCVSCIGRWILYHCTTWEAQNAQYTLLIGRKICFGDIPTIIRFCF